MSIGATTLATYNFSGANGTTPPNGSGDTPGCTILDSNPTPAQIQGNACQFTGNYSSNPNLLRLLPKSALGDVPTRTELAMSASVADTQGLFWLASGTINAGTENGYFVYFDSYTLYIDKYVSGVATNLLTSFWSGVTLYGGPSVRFDFDIVGGNVVITLRTSSDSYASSKTVTDSSSPITTAPDIIFFSADDPGNTSTIDTVTIQGTSSAPISATGNAIEPATDTASGSAATINKGLRTPTIYEPNNDSVVADASGVRAIVRDAIGGNELLDISTAAIVSGVCTIDSDAVGALGATAYLDLQWSVSGQTRFVSVALTVINLDA